MTDGEDLVGDDVDLVAVDDAHAEVARELLQAIEEGGPGRPWRMPWHAHAAAPANAFSGRHFKGQNLLVLWAAARRHRHRVHLWASEERWRRAGARLREGAPGCPILVPVYDEQAAPRRVEPDAMRRDRKRYGPVGGDAQGMEQRPLLGFRRQRWYNHAEVDGAPPAGAPPRTGSEAAALAEAIMADWRARPRAVVSGRQVRGPGLVHGGLRAAWQPASDVVQLPARAAFGDHGVLSGREAYAATLIHEGVHATGSKGRLRRPSLLGYSCSRTLRAAEELVAELGAAMLGARIGLATELREDHAIYLDGWMSAFADRGRADAWLRAVADADRAVSHIVWAADRDPETLQRRNRHAEALEAADRRR